MSVRSHVSRRRVWAAGLFGGVAVAVALLASAGKLLVLSRSVPSPDAIVVLASHQAERLPAAANLARQFPSALVLLTDPTGVSSGGRYTLSGRVAKLQGAGVSAARIEIIPDRVLNTYDESNAVIAYAKRRHLRSLVVVTSPYHTRRALATFAYAARGAAIPVGVYPATVEAGARPAFWWRRAYDRWYVPYEWAALAWYAVRRQLSPLV